MRESPTIDPHSESEIFMQKPRYVMSQWGLTALTVTLLLTGCLESPSSFTVENRDGITHAINRHGWKVWHDSAAAPVTFVREQTYGTNEDASPALLGEITGLAVDSAGTVYVLDGANHCLVAFNPDGSVRWSAGRRGEGPGEFWRSGGMVLGDSGHLYITNDSGHLIDVWTTSGKFVERATFEEKDLGFLNLVGYAKGALIVSESGFGNEPQSFHALNPETWTLVHSSSLNAELKLSENVGVSRDASTIGDSIYVSGLSEYTLSRYSVDGTLGYRITRSVAPPPKPAVYDGGVRFYGGLNAPVRLHNGHLLVSVSWASNVDDPNAHYRRSKTGSAEKPVFTTALDLLSPTGRYIGSLHWKDRTEPSIGDPNTVGPNGKLYTTTSDPYPQVRRYDVTLRPE